MRVSRRDLGRFLAGAFAGAGVSWMGASMTGVGESAGGTTSGVGESVDGTTPVTATGPSRNTAERDDVVVARTGDDIQRAIDALVPDGGGIVQLLPKVYTPPTGIVLKGTVTLRGAGGMNLRAPHAETWITADHVRDGNSLVRWRPNAEPDAASGAQVRNIGFAGKRREGVRAHGLELPPTVGNPRIVNCYLTEFWGSGALFAGTQSAEVLRTRIARCGTAAEDTHGLDVGGTVTADDFDRATVICAGFFGNGPISRASPCKLRNGSTLRMKSVGYRTGFRGHGPMGANPVVDVDGGDLVMDNALLTTNITGGIGAGIRIRNGGSVSLHNCTVEKADPNIRYEAGSLSLDSTAVRQAKTYANGNGMGDGLWVADSGKAEEYEITDSSFVGNQGDGLDLGRPGIGVHSNVRTQGNDGWGINAGRLSGVFEVIGLDGDDDKQDALGSISHPDRVARGSDALE